MMSDFRQARGILAQTLMALALMAAVLQSGMPRGVMVDRDASGQLAIVFCTGHGSATRWLDLETGQVIDAPDGEPASSQGEPCAFAMATALADLPTETVLARPAGERTAATWPDRPALAERIRAHRPPARGPPATL